MPSLILFIFTFNCRSTQVAAQNPFNGILKAKFSLKYRIDGILA